VEASLAFRVGVQIERPADCEPGAGRFIPVRRRV